MIYTLENTVYAGHPVKQVFDANGLEWRDILRMDTETGEITKYVRDTNGQLVEHPDGGEMLKEAVKAAAPLRVTFQELSDEDREFAKSLYSGR